MLRLAAPAALLALLVCAFLPAAAEAKTTYGEIVLEVEAAPQGTTAHGYSEYRFQIVNRSADRGHQVTLSLPHQSFGGRYDTSIRSVSQSVEVGAGQTVTVSLLCPPRPEVNGRGVAVTIDGQLKEEPVPLNVGAGYGSSGPSTLVLVSRRVLPGGDPFGPFGGGPGRGGGFGLPHVYFPTRSFGVMRADQVVTAWGANWLSYSRYDGIVVTAEDLDDLIRAGAAGQAVRTALWQYAETGGSLLIVGPGKVALPPGWSRYGEKRDGWATYRPGFGVCFVSPDREYQQWSRPGPGGPERWNEIERSWHETRNAWGRSGTLSDLNQSFPVVENLGVPVRGLFVLMILFSLTIGPLNLGLLARRKRKIWMLWTVPLISFCTCVAVFGYMVIAEGWQGHARTDSVTVLDQTGESPRAATLGRSGLYSPLTPGDGLRYSIATEVTALAVDRGSGGEGGGAPRTVEWGGDQHLARGWLTARVPSYFLLRKSEVRRERITISKGEDGKLTALNALGADVKALWYADEKGRLHSAGPVTAGAQATLAPSDKSLSTKGPGQLRERFYSKIGALPLRRAVPEEVLVPRTYLAELDASPFLEPGLRRARARGHRSVVIGILKEGD